MLKDRHFTSITTAERRAVSAQFHHHDMKREDHLPLAGPTVELIEPYTFGSRGIKHDKNNLTAKFWSEVCSTQGGFNPATRELTPLRFASAEMRMDEALDHLTAAAEAGIVDKNRWSEQLFANAEELEAFFDELECYDDCYRITDRWWTALAQLSGRVDEEAFVSCQEIVRGLRDSIDAGKARQEKLKQEAEYFAQVPLVEVKCSRAEEAALEQHNREVRQRADNARLPYDVSCKFRLTQPFLYLKGKSLAKRQVTKEDLAELVAAKEKKPSVAKDAAPKKTTLGKVKQV